MANSNLMNDSAVMTQPEPRRAYRPVSEIIQQFLQEIENHPDAQFGNCALNGPCPQNLLLKNIPRGRQHLTELRIVHVDAAETQEVKANKPWKWQGLIDSLNQAAAPPEPEKPNPRWAHLIPPNPNTPKPELQEVSV